MAPGEGETQKPRGSLLPVLMVLTGAVAVVMTLIVFTGRAGLLMVLAVGALLSLPVLHYLTWGWWLSKIIRREQEAEDARQEDARQENASRENANRKDDH